MKNFMNALQNECNYEITENGALAFKTTRSQLVDFQYKVSSYRNCEDAEIIEDFKKVINENLQYALKLLFYIRDVRGGLGERRLFRLCLPLIEKEIKVDTNTLCEWVIEYGRYDDLFCLLQTERKTEVLKFIDEIFHEDWANYESKKPVSLLAKWLPSENASSLETKALAKQIRQAMGFSPKTYRQALSALRKYLDVTEVKTSSNQWEEIKYESVPSKANLLYKDAFLKHDEDRRRAFLDKATNGEIGMKAGVLFPHDIVHKYANTGWGVNVKDYDAALEALWKNLAEADKAKGGIENLLVVRDGSGSMTSNISGTSVTALDVSTALAIYCAEREKEPFKNKFITFSATPKFVDLSKEKTLHDKLQLTYKETECSNTNIELTMDLILQTAVRNQLKQEEIPTVLIISDMEFDFAIGSYYGHANKRLFEHIAQKFDMCGYKLPRMVFWNVMSRTKAIPMIQNDLGVILVSGFSQNVLNMVLNNETDPLKALLSILDSDRYANIKI